MTKKSDVKDIPKQYDISYSRIFLMAHGTPWIVQCEGEYGCWNFKTKEEAVAFVEEQGDGVLRRITEVGRHASTAAA